MKIKVLILMLTLLCFFVCYQMYLRFPQRYDVGSCIIDSQSNEIYKIMSEAKRRLSFKDHWFFAPMTIEIEAIKINPNTLRQVGEVQTVEQDDNSFSISPCP